MNRSMEAWLGWHGLIEMHAAGLLLLKATLILIVAWGAHGALVRANPRWRVLLWRMTASALLALPIIALVLPAIRLEITRQTEFATPANSFPDAGDSSRIRPGGEHARPNLGALPMATPGPRTVAYPSVIASASEFPGPRLGIAWLITFVWLGGILFRVIRFALAQRRLAELIRTAVPATDEICDLAARVGRELGVGRIPRTLFADGTDAPMLTGVFGPVILIPARMRNASYRNDLPGILAHELAHLRSSDLAWFYALEMVSSLLWLHPLVWGISRVHAAACERVSDAVSASYVGDASAYSRTLARVAIEIATAPAGGAIPMARGANIMRRLEALRLRVFADPLNRRRVAIALIGGLLLVGVVGGLRFAYAEKEAPAEPAGNKGIVVEGNILDENGKPVRGVDAAKPKSGLGGLIKNEKDEPVEGVKVEVIVEHCPDESKGSQTSRFQAASDSAGKWEVEGPTNVTRIDARYEHPDYVSDRSFNESGKPPPVDHFVARTAIQVMKKGVDVEGTILDPQGKPVSDAFVRLGVNPNEKIDQTKSDTRGWFQFRNLPPGSSFVTVEKRKYAPDLKTITIVPGMKPVELHLGTPNSIRFHIQDPEGVAIQGAQVTVFSWREAFSLRMGRFTDNQGNAAWDSAPQDAVLYDVLAKGFMYARRQELAARDEPYVITIRRPLKITAKVIDAVTREPIKEFKIVPSWNVEGDRVEWDFDRATWGKDGAFTATIDEPYERHYYRIEAADYPIAISRPFLDDEPEVSLEIALDKSQSESGIVRAPDGKPAARAELAIVEEGSDVRYTNATFNSSREVTRIVSDEAGRFQMPPREKRFGIIVTHEKGFAALTDKELGATHDIELVEWARVEGKAFAGAKAAARVIVRLSYAAYPQVAGMTYYPDYETTTGDDGSFTFDRVMPLGVAFVSREAAAPPGSITVCSTPLLLEPGTSETIQVGGRGAR